MKKQWAIQEYDSAFPAIVAIVSGLIYFLRFHTVKTILVLVVVFGFLGYVARDYLTKERISIEKLSPLEASKDGGFNLSLIDRAYAGEPQGLPIVIGGKRYGYYDPSFQIWKVQGQARIVIYDSTSGAILGAEIPLLQDRERMKLMK